MTDRRRKGFSIGGLGDRLRGFGRDRKGAAALEFALVVPLLFSFYFVTMEIAQAIETNKKVARVGAMVADLVTRQRDMTRGELEAIMAIGAGTLQPYARTRPNIVITAISTNGDSDPQASVVWSRQVNNGVFGPAQSPGTRVQIPQNVSMPNAFFIRVESKLDYRPMITWTAEQRTAMGLAGAFDSIAMGATYHNSPRVNSTIPCSNC